MIKKVGLNRVSLYDASTRLKEIDIFSINQDRDRSGEDVRHNK